MNGSFCSTLLQRKVTDAFPANKILWIVLFGCFEFLNLLSG